MKSILKNQRLTLGYRFVLLSSFGMSLFVSSCGKIGGLGGTKGTKGGNVPVALVLNGSATINAGECQPYRVTSVNTEGVATPVTQDIPLKISQPETGGFFDDSSCNNSISKFTVTSGASNLVIYYLSHTAGVNHFTVSGSPTFNTTLSLTITVLPQTNVSISDGPSYDFGPHYLNTLSEKLFTVTNSGASDITHLEVGTPTLSAPFFFKGGAYPGTGGTCGSSLGSEGASCTIVLNYLPTALGVDSGTLVLQYSDSLTTQSTSRSLSGTGVDSGSLNFKGTLGLDLGDDRAFGTAIQSDGKLLVAGYSNRSLTGNDFSVARFSSTGTLDTSFGSGGKAFASFGAGDDRALAITLQPDGKILLAGYATIAGVYQFAIARFTSSGALDSSFGTSGLAATPIGTGNSFAFGIALQPDGNMVLAGYSQASGGNHITLARFTSSGNLDNTFGTAGTVVSAVGAGSSYANAVAIDGSGNIVVAGYATSFTIDFAVLRYQSNGTLDNTFATGGVSLTDLNGSTDYAYALGLQSDGKIVVAGTSIVGGDNHFAAIRLTTSGSLDNSFSGDGKLTQSVAAHYDEAHALSIQSNGKIVLGGFAYTGTRYDFAFLRCNVDGSVDSSFGGSGISTINFGASASSRAYSLSIAADGTIYAAGDTQSGADFDYAIGSLLP